MSQERPLIDVKTLIRPYTRQGSYRVNVSLDAIPGQIARWSGTRNDNYYLDMDPDFQRGHKWTVEQQQAFVVYLLRGGNRMNEIMFNCSTWGDQYNTPIEVVDGKQRLTAVMKFMNNELDVLDGHYAKDFNYRTLSNAELVFTVNNLKTRKEVLQWYLDLNTGGTPHTEEEISNVQLMLQVIEDTEAWKGRTYVNSTGTK